MLFDAHIHLLPGLGGDPTDLSQSIEMLSLLHGLHVRGALALTRYNPYLLPYALYVRRFEERAALLRSCIKEHAYRVRPIFASEVLYTQGMHKDFDLTLFTIPKTRLLPLLYPLLPFEDDWMRDLSYIISKLHLTPIICHFEQQFLLHPERNAARFTGSSNMIYQISSHSLRNRSFAKFVLENHRRGKRFIIGSGADVPEVLKCDCYASDAWGLDGLQSVAHKLLYRANEDFRREISFYG